MDAPLTFADPVLGLTLVALAVPLAAFLERRAGGSLASAAFRAVLVLTLALAAARPALVGEAGQDVVVLVDTSASVDPAALATAQAGLGAAAAGAPVIAVAAAAGAVPDDPSLARQTDATVGGDSPIGAALAAARTFTRSGSRLVLVSDGHSTDTGAAAAAARLNERGVSVDVVPVAARPRDYDGAVTHLVSPQVWRRGLPIPVEVMVRGPGGASASLALVQNGDPAARAVLELEPGAKGFSFELESPQADVAVIEAVLELPGDSQPGNNRRGTAIHLVPPPAVLVVGEGIGAVALADRLVGAGAEVTVVGPEGLSADSGDRDLTRWDAFVLADTPADRLDPAAGSSLAAAVAEGAGLLLTAGRQSFAAGGWEGTPLAELSPVELAAPDRAAREPVAMVLVVDVSGSMAAQAPSVPVTKLDLAREAALLAAAELAPLDKLGVVTYDDEPDVVAPLAQAGDGQATADLAAGLAALEAGGGTRIVPALTAGLAMLAGERGDSRYMVLVSDGQDSAAGADELLASASVVRAAGVTLSTIAVGDDAERTVLANMAKIGRGRAHMAQSPEDLPRLTVEESRIVTGGSERRGTFMPEVGDLHPWRRLLGGLPPPLLAGYLAVVERPAADVILRVPGGDPLLVVRPYGGGAVAAWMSDLGDEWAPAWLESPPAAGFWSALVLSLARDPAAAFEPVTTAIRSGQALIEVDLGADHPADVRLEVIGATGATETRTIAMRAVGPGKFAASVPVSAGAQPVRVVTGGATRALGAVVWDGPAEAWSQPGTGAPLLEALAAAGGGRVRHWSDALAPVRSRNVPLGPPLAAVAACLWLAEVARQLGAYPRAWRRPGPMAPKGQLRRESGYRIG